MGHYIAVKRRGLQADLPDLRSRLSARTFAGTAWVSRAKTSLPSRLQVPLFGLTRCADCRWASLLRSTHYAPSCLVLANLTAWYNLLNLAPVFGLDGAKVVLALSSKLQRGDGRESRASCCSLLMSARDVIRTAQHQQPLRLPGAGRACWLIRRSPLRPKSRTRAPLRTFSGVLLVLGGVLHLTGLQAFADCLNSPSQFRIR